ncbi:MAG: tRNA pseudouridine(38-40) synthase TruA [Bacteroidota bacterium]
MAAYKLTIEYDGTRFRGWQTHQSPVSHKSAGGLVHRSHNFNRGAGGQGQKNAHGIQGELVIAATALLGSPVDIQGSGRTDAGVHALAQVAHLISKKSLPCLDIQNGLNDRLPLDINILRVESAPKNFHARHDAIGRSYLYQISKRRTALGERFVWWIKDTLDTASMAKGIRLCNGMHDFSSFCDTDDEQKSTKVLVEQTELRELPEMILIRIRASHFLWKMVRRLVGTLVEIGRHTITIQDLEQFLTTTSKKPAEWTAPPTGLFLEQVRYKGEHWYEPLEPVVQIPSIRTLSGQ